MKRELSQMELYLSQSKLVTVAETTFCHSCAGRNPDFHFSLIPFHFYLPPPVGGVAFVFSPRNLLRGVSFPRTCRIQFAVILSDSEGSQ